jgi:PAS domain S-box-containing protein
MEVSKDLYTDICNGFEIGIVIHNATGEIMEANDTAKRILGQSSRQLIGPKSVFWNVFDADGNKIKKKEHPVYRAIEARQQIQTIIFIKSVKPKNDIWLRLQVIPEYKEDLKNPSQIISTFIDISSQKSDEQLHHDRKERLLTLVEQGTDAIFLSTINGEIIDVNQHACDILGYTREELMSMKVTDIDAEVPNKGELNKFWKTLKIGTPVKIRGAHRKKSGETIPVEIRVALIHIAGKKSILGFARDISDRIQLEEQLHLFKSAVDSSLNAIGISTPEGKHYYQNRTFNKLFGTISSDPPASLYVNESVGREVFETIMRGGHWNGEVKMFGKNRKILTILLRAYSLVDNDNKVIGLVCVHMDLTEMRKAEIEMNEKETLYRQLLDNLNDSVFFHPYSEHKVPRFTEVNNAACKRYGYTYEEFLKLSPKDINSKKSRENPSQLEVIKQVHEKGNLIFERQHITKTGEVFPVEINSTIIQINDKKFVLAVVRDITDRMKEEYQRKVLQKGIDRSQIGVFQLDDNGDIYYANDFACESLGYTREELLKLSVYDIDPTFDTNKWKAHRKKTQTSKVLTIETIHRKKDGLEFPVEITINFVEIDGKLLSFSFVKDISERKKAIAAIRKQNREYLNLNKEYQAQNQELIESLNRIQKINTELNRAKSRAEESDRLKTAFLANMSHEIRTPMNGILGFADLLTDPENSPESQQKYIQIIQQSGKRMLNIINDLIDISKIEAGQVELKIEQINLNELFDNMFNFFLPEAKARSLSLTYRKDLPNDESVILTDSTKLNQVLSNFIKNALKYTDKGQVSFGYVLKSNIIEFYVEDTGIGISSKIQKKIFERFRQGHLSETKVYEGAGLGLSISKAFIEILGGKVNVRSTVGKGSLFSFTLPYRTAKPNRKSTDTGKSSELNTSKEITILVADDDEISYLLIKDILRKQNVKVIWVNDGKKAVEIVSSNKEIDLILMDIRLPVLNGYEATRQIKEIRSNLPVIAQTAFASSTDREQALKAGCNDYISKPINSPLLIDKINYLTNPLR